MNIYYELADCVVGEQGKYFAIYNCIEKSGVGTSKYRKLMQNSNRAWAEDEHGVRFLKHRYESLGTAKVDMKEFFWIKLKSQTV